jgi:hypothetical protein
MWLWWHAALTTADGVLCPSSTNGDSSSALGLAGQHSIFSLQRSLGRGLPDGELTD